MVANENKRVMLTMSKEDYQKLNELSKINGLTKSVLFKLLLNDFLEDTKLLRKGELNGK